MYNRKDIFYKLYRNTGAGYAMFKNIPIVLLDDFKKSFANDGKFRIRYRGPRAHNVTRYHGRRQSTCLKKDAERFSVYRTY
jgi:hypothetical protein